MSSVPICRDSAISRSLPKVPFAKTSTLMAPPDFSSSRSLNLRTVSLKRCVSDCAWPKERTRTSVPPFSSSAPVPPPPVEVPPHAARDNAITSANNADHTLFILSSPFLCVEGFWLVIKNISKNSANLGIYSRYSRVKHLQTAQPPETVLPKTPIANRIFPKFLLQNIQKKVNLFS